MSSRQHFLTSVQSCRSDDSLRRVATAMWQHGCRYLLVVDTEGTPVDVITLQDLLRAARQYDQPLAQIRVSKVVSPHRLARPASRSLMTRAYGARRQRGHQIPVFDMNGKLVSIVRENWLKAVV